MSAQTKTVLVIGATGSVGRHVVAEATRQGYAVRALARDSRRAAAVLPGTTEIVIGDVTRPETLRSAVRDVDGVVFTHGSHGGGMDARTVDYGAVLNVLSVLGDNRPHLALMTAIGVTVRDGSYNQQTQIHDWKRRAERLVRRSGLPYTIVRPGWFDYNDADQHQLVLLQGDKRRAGNSSDGAIARTQIAKVLVTSLSSPAADRKTFELVADHGPAQNDLQPLFAALDADPAGAYDGVHDLPNQPLDEEPDTVRSELGAITRDVTA
jgi:uncharacterized protein YbjT (DUF2867 family)